jgi:hypothetical protein
MSSRSRNADALQRMVGALVGVVVLLALPSVATAAPSSEPFALVPGSFHVVTSSTQAGAHADLTTSFDIAHEASGRTYNDLRTAIIEYPPGEVGNNNAVPTCTPDELIGGSEQIAACPVASQVGTISFEAINLNGGAPAHFTVPLYNMEVTSPGVVTAIGFRSVVVTEIFQIRVRPGDSGLTATSPNNAKFEPFNIVVTVWGVPASHVHDDERAVSCGEGFELPPQCKHQLGNGGPLEAGIPIKPYLSNPTSCVPHVAHMAMYSWEMPEEPFWVHGETEQSATTECERVPFDPAIEVRPTTRSAESPSGLDVSLVLPQSWDDPNRIATSDLKDSTVTLPVGYTINPSSGSGLKPCTVGEFEEEAASASPPGHGCPPESKIGTVTVETPVLTKTLKGNIYVAMPFQNKFGSLLALYVVVKDPARGIVVKLAGKITPNETTGQLVTTFDENPQVPFSRFTLELLQATTSPLVSPPVCGSYAAEADLTPWSAPESPHHVLSPSFQIETGIGGGACPTGGVPPLKPQVLSGTENNASGTYSSFYLRIERHDGEQELTKFTTILPPGLTANLTGIPFCPDAAIQHAREASGQQEIGAPSCPASSEIGHTLVGAGVGSVLAWTPGKVYLAGPYHGSALSIVSITSATVGPFDLGTVVIRFALRINPTTGQAEIDSTGSDPIPHIIKGIIVHVRDIHVYVDRSKFMINPTSCQALSIANTITGAGAEPANPADQQSVSVTTPFRAADCSSLGFKPLFEASTSGKTSRSSGASLSVKLTYPNAPLGTQANIHSVKVDLPKQLPSRLTTLQKACVDSVFNANPAACPAASRVGTAKAITPILPVPIEGPAYFVSHGGAKFPELIVVLQGYGVTIDLHGETFINKEGVTSSTFRSVPDQPVTSFELTLPQGPDSALAANGNLCSLTRTVLTKRKVTVRVKGHNKTVTRKVPTTLPASLTMPTAFTAQNGMVIKQSTLITVTGCGKAARKAKGSRQGKGRKG